MECRSGTEAILFLYPSTFAKMLFLITNTSKLLTVRKILLHRGSAEQTVNSNIMCNESPAHKTQSYKTLHWKSNKQMAHNSHDYSKTTLLTSINTKPSTFCCSKFVCLFSKVIYQQNSSVSGVFNKCFPSPSSSLPHQLDTKMSFYNY